MPQPKPSQPPTNRGPLSLLTPGREVQLRRLAAKHPQATFNELARRMGHIASPDTIRNWCIKLGLTKRRSRGARSRLTPKIEKILRRLMVRQPTPYYREMVRAIGEKVHRRTLRKWCQTLGLPHNSITGNRSGLTPEMESRLRSLMAERPQASYRELAEALRSHLTTVSGWVKRLGLPHSGPGKRFNPDKLPRLRELLRQKPDATYRELAQDLQVRPQTVFRWIKRLGIPRRRRAGPPLKMTSEKETRLRALVAENPTVKYRNLAGTLKVSPATIMRYVRRLKLNHRDGRKNLR